MTQQLKPIIVAGDVAPDWIELRREVIQRDGYALRAGNPHHTIEVKSLRDNRWLLLPLPNDAPHFATAEDRDAILAQLQKGPQS